MELNDKRVSENILGLDIISSKPKSKHKFLSFLSRDKPSLRRSLRLHDKENDPIKLTKHSSLQDLTTSLKNSSLGKVVSSKSEKKRKISHQPIIKQTSKSCNMKTQKTLKRMRSSNVSLQSFEHAKPAKRPATEIGTLRYKANDQDLQCNSLNRRSLKSGINRVVSFASRFSPRIPTETRDRLNQTHSGEFARPFSSPVHSFSRQGSKKYKQLPTPIKRRPSKLWIDTIPHLHSKIKASLSPLEIKRQEAIFELYSGEDDMVEDLRLLREVYFNPMAKLGLIDEQELQQIFGFIYVILPLHEDLVQKLRSLKNDHDMVDNIGDVLLEWVPTLKPYINYCAKQVLAKDILDHILKADNGVADFLERCRESPFSRKLELWSFLDAPRGRLVKYPLLFNAIKKLTPKDHPDRNLLEKVVDEIELIISQADRETGRFKCEHIRQKLYFLDPQHASAIDKASALSCSGILRNKNGTKLHVFLFDNVLVMSRPATRQGKLMFQVSHQPVEISSLSVEDLPDGEVKIGGSFKNTLTKHQLTDKHLFRIFTQRTPQVAYTFQALDDHDKKQWIKALTSLLNKRRNGVSSRASFCDN